MKKPLLVISGILMAIAVFLVLKDLDVTEQEEVTIASAAALLGSDTVTLTEDESYDEGTTQNPFVILEIVPYEGYAELGYMIKGCEPVPMDTVAYDKAGGALVTSATTGMKGDWVDEFTYELPNGDNVILNLTSPVDSTNIVALTNLTDFGKWRNADKPEYGYYQKVTDGTGTYLQEKRTINGAEAVVYIQSATGNYNWVPYTDSTKPDGIHTAYDMWKVTQTFGASEVHTYRTKFYRGKYKFTYDENYNKFLMEVLGVPYADVANYQAVVLTITPEQLSMQTDLIDKADLISFAPNSHFYNSNGTNDMVALWEKYHTTKKITSPATSFGFKTGYTTCNDLTWEATAEIMRKASVDNNIAPIVFDASIYTSDTSMAWYTSSTVSPAKKYSNDTTVTSADITAKGYFNNICKLYLVMEQMNPAKFYNEYIATNLIRSIPVTTGGTTTRVKIGSGSVTLTTGYYTEQQTATAPAACNITTLNFKPAAVAWSIYTFLPYQFFANKAALNSNGIWPTVGIDNYTVINSTIGNVSVRHNIYTYDTDQALTKQLTLASKIAYNTATKEAFDYYEQSTGTLSPAKAIKYLWKLQTKLTYNTTNLRILEIEPCKDFLWNGGETAWDANDTNKAGLSNLSKYERQFFARYFPHYNANVTIATMSTAEFIGNVEDINTKYDMIFFGLRTGMMTKNSGATIYNDTALNGKIYLHNGDQITMSISKLKGLDDDLGTNTYRFAGNDITLLKYNELIDFMKSGNPIIFDNGFYNADIKTVVNTTYIDTTSYMFDLTNVINSTVTYKNQLFSTVGFDAYGISIYGLESKLSVNKCKIVFGNLKGTLNVDDCKPVTYKDKTVSGNESLPDSKIFINANNPSFRTLQYKFYISSGIATSTDYYTAKLYIDINADGKYDEDTERISGLQIMTDKGYVVNYKKLQPGVNYTLSRTLEADYFGVLPWKLEIVSNTNTEVRDSAIDYCALKTKTPIDLYILQIKSNSGNNLDLAAGMTNTSSPFYKPLNNLIDYKIHITSWTVDEFTAKCQAVTTKYGQYTYMLSDDNDLTADGKNLSNNDDGDDFYDFDMLIMGFADCYSDIGSDVALHNIQDFIEEGKSVLFTHDTTSFVNMPKSEYQGTYGFDDFWGYGLNSTFRNVFGMDRFGVTISDEASRSTVNKDYAYKDSSSNKKYNGFIQGYNDMVLNRYAASNKWVYSYHYQWVNTNWVYSYHYQWIEPAWGRYSPDYDFIPSDTNDWPSSYRYEYGRAWYNRKWNYGYWLQYVPLTDPWGWQNGYYDGYWIDGYWGDTQQLSHINVTKSDFTTNKVTKANQGQLTVYPYNIPDTFTVATTHAQYYQLDMEDDDIVVWYCLSDNTTGGSGRYSSVENDVRNNYYIYNVGNITYSGVGHSTVTSETEAKLFVNTMVGSYTATAKDPKIKITNKNYATDNITTYVYVDYDIYDTSLAMGNEVTMVDSTKDSTISSSAGSQRAQLVKFMIDDYNILFNKKIYINFADNPSGANTQHLYYMVNTQGTPETSDDTVINKVSIGGTYMYPIDASEEYAIAVPLLQLNSANLTDTIGINVLITYGKTSTKTKTAFSTFKLIRRGLFDLD